MNFVFASRDGEREKRKVRSPSPRLTSSTSSGAQQLKASTPSRQDEANKSLKSLGMGKDEYRAKKAPAEKKSRVRKLSSSSSSDSGEGSSSESSRNDSSSSEDKAIGKGFLKNYCPAKEKMPRGKTERGLIIQINANNLCQRKFL